MAAESEMQEYFEWAGSVVAAFYEATMKGGELQAAFYQGADEIGAALKAFPDAIQVQEPGTAFDPLYRNRAGELPTNEGSNAAPETLPSPSEIAAIGSPDTSIVGPAQETGQSLPSPSEIANSDIYGQQPDGGKNNDMDQGMDLGRGM